MSWCDIAGRFKHVPENIKVVEALTVCTAMRYRPLSVLARAFKQAADYVPGFHAQGLLQKHIGPLSGGQRKRVSDAIEMLKPVTLNIYDEPCSGLDRHSTLQLFKSIRTVLRSNQFAGI